MKKQIARLIIALFATLSAVHAEIPVDTTLTLGYDSRYLLYGYRLTRHLYHADVYLSHALDEKTTLWGGAWYGYLPDGTYNEVDVYTGIDRTLGEYITIGAAYSLFNYIEVPYETSDHVSELAAHATFATDQFSLQFRNQYDSEANGYLLRGIANYTQPLVEKLSLGLEAEGGYALGYFIQGNLWNHALASVKTTYSVTESLSIEPYITRSIPLAAIDDYEEYDTIYGISASYFF